MLKHLTCALFFVLSALYTTSVQAQTTIWLEDFSGTNQGWTQNFTDCDGTAQSFAGKRNNRFEEQDMEGAPCCGSGGANGNYWEIDSLMPISISGYCNVTISVNFGSTTNTLECVAGGPFFTCQGNPLYDNGHDQMVFYYSLDGGPWVQFFYQCGNALGTNTATIGCLTGSTLRVRIMPATKAIDEIYWFDNVKIVGTPAFSMTQPTDVAICAGQPVMVNFAGGPMGATYTWTNDNPAIGLAASGTGNLNFTSAAVATQQVANITVTPHMGACCAGTPVTFTITINPLPTVTVPANITVCSGDPVSATFGGTGTTFNWTNSNANIGLSATGSGDISFTSTGLATTQTGTITVTPTDGTCTGAPKTFTITVNPLPNVNQPSDVTACGGSTVNINLTGTGGTTFMWTNDNPAIGLGASGTGNISFASATVSSQEVALITVTPKTATCTGVPKTFTITINPTPTFTPPANQIVCGGAQVMIAFQGTNSPNFNWTNSNPAIGLPSTGNGDLNFTASNVVTNQVATITVTPVTGGCTGTAHSFTITVSPSPNVNPPANVTVCAGNPVTVNFTGTAGATFAWTNDNTNIGLAAAGTGNISFTSANVATQQVANITVTAQNSNCTGTSQTFTITINPPPAVNAPANQSVCAGTPIAVTFTGTGNPTLNWTNSNPAIGLPASGTGNLNFTSANVATQQIATITVTPSITGCTGTAKTFTITVSPIPTATAPADQSVCAGAPLAVALTGSAGATFDWTCNNAAIGLPPSGTGNISFTSAAVTTQQVATIAVTPKIGSCTGTPVSFTITINPAPVVNPVSNITVCPGVPVSVPFTGTGAAYTWTNSNTAIGLPPAGIGNISFVSANVGATTVGTIVVTPASGACPGIAQTFTITIQSPPTVNQTPNQVTCSNSPLAVNFTGNGGAVFNWTNNNTAIGLPASGTGNISFTAANAASPVTGTITVTPVSGTCNGTPETFTITVTPVLSVDQPADTTGCSGAPISVVFTGTASANFAWTNTNTAIGLGASGSGNLSFTAATVATQQVATITVSPQAGLCAGLAAQFTITINPTPGVNASTDQAACAGQTIAVAFSGTAGSYNWTNDNPAIGLGASGTGDINFMAANIASNQTGTLIVTPAAGPSGCAGTPDTFLITVVTTPTLNALNNPAACAGDSVSVPFAGTAGTTFSWTNSNPAIGLPASGAGSLHFLAASVATQTIATLTVTPQIGTCTGNPVTFTITVNPIPSMTVPGNLIACPGNIIQVNYQGSPANVGFNWTNSDPAIGLPASGTGNLNFPTTNAGTTDVTSTVSVQPTLAGCTAPAQTFTITVKPAPTVAAVGNQTACPGEAVTVHFSGTTNPTFSWSNSNPAIGLGASGTGDISFTAAGVVNPVTASIVVTPTENGCTGPVKTFNITVAPAPTMSTPADTAICSGQPLQIGFTGSASATFSWTNDNPAIGLPASGTGDLNFTTALVATQQVAHITATPQIGACPGPTVTFSITVKPLPVTTPSADQTVCSGQTTTINFSGSAGAAFNWTSSNPATGLPAMGSGNIPFTAASVASNTLTTIIVSPSDNGCTGKSDTFDVTILAMPPMNAPANQTFCSGTAGNIPFSGPAGTTFTWTNDNPAIGLPATGSGDINFNAVNIGVQLVANIAVTPHAGACAGNPVNFTITIHPAPTMTAPTNAVGCAGQTITMNFSGGPAGTVYNWTNSNPAIGLAASGAGNISFTSAAVVATQTGQIAVTPVESGCSGQPVTANIVVNALPVVNPVADQTVCANAPVTQAFSGSIGASFSWSNTNTAIGLGATGTGNLNFTAANVAVNQTGTILVTPSAGACTGVPQLFNIHVDALPTVNNPGNQSVCAKGNLSVTLTGSAGATFNWTNSNPAIGLAASGTGNISFTAAGAASVQTATITVTPQSATCAGTPVSFTVTVNPLPVATIAGNQSLCAGANTTLTASGGSTYSWNGAQTTAAITVSPAGNTTYTVTVSTAAGCTATTVATVSVHQPNAITIQKTSCLPADTGVVVVTLHNQFGCDSVVTTHTSLLPGSLVNLTKTTCHQANAGTFTQHFTNHFGCDSTVITTVVFDPALIDTTHLNSTTCVPSQAGSSQVLLTGSNGCDSLVITQVVYDPALCGVVATVQATGISCASSADGSATVNVSTGVTPFQYTWTDGAGHTGSGQINALNAGTQITSLAPGTFSITVTQSVGLSTVLTAQITAPLPVTAQVQAVLAFNNYAVSCSSAADGTAKGQAFGGTPPYQYAWSNGTSVNPATGLAAGNYTMTVTDQKGCTAVASVGLTPPPPLDFRLGLARPNCGDLSVEAAITPTGGVGPYTISIDSKAITGATAPVTGGIHLIEVTDANGCKADSAVSVVIPSAVKILLPADTVVDLGESLTLEAQTNLGLWKSLTWQPLPDTTCPACLIQTWTPLQSQAYTVSIVDTFGCTAKATTLVTVRNKADLYIPNVFLPNDNGINDLFKVNAGPGVTSLDEIRIFDRWGSLVYAWTSPVPPNEWPGWDGATKGQKVTPGVYVYYFKIKLLNGRTDVLKGDITVVK